MAWQDSDISGGKVRLKVSRVAGETISDDGLVPGEVAINEVDGRLFYQGGSFPSATGVHRIVTLTQAAYDALAPDATTLYIITPNP